MDGHGISSPAHAYTKFGRLVERQWGVPGALVERAENIGQCCLSCQRRIVLHCQWLIWPSESCTLVTSNINALTVSGDAVEWFPQNNEVMIRKFAICCPGKKGVKYLVFCPFLSLMYDKNFASSQSEGCEYVVSTGFSNHLPSFMASQLMKLS